MADGFAMLGDVLGGGIDRAGAYDAGRLHRAKTEDALARARIARDEATMRESLGDALAGAEVPNPEAIAAVMRAGFGNFQQATAGQGNLLENSLRGNIADPATDPDARHYARSALFSDPANLTLADELTQAEIDYKGAQTGASEALADLRERKRLEPREFLTAPKGGSTPEEIALEAFAESFGTERGYQAVTGEGEPVEGPAADIIAKMFTGGGDEPVRLDHETGEAVFAQLPSGALFIDPDGNLRRKP